jgi:hypothetical protein
MTYLSVDNVGTYKVGQPVPMYESILGNTSLLVESYEFTNKFSYSYEACIRTSCSDKQDVVTADVGKSKKLLVLSGTLSLDTGSTFYQNSKKGLTFFDAFVQIRYDDKIATVKNVTPSSITEKYILQVDENVEKAKKIELIISVRNKKYVLTLK